MILCVILSLVQFSTISLIQEVLTKDATKWWFRVIVGMIIAKAILAALIISVNCSPAGTLAGKDNINCSNNVCRASFPTHDSKPTPHSFKDGDVSRNR